MNPNRPSSQTPTGAKSPANVGKAPIAPGSSGPADAGRDLPMPHERDESVGGAAEEPRPVIEQARRDIESGQVDTDMRATPGLDAKRRDAIQRGR